MHREIVQACLPCLVALTAGFIALWLLVRLSGAKFNAGRLWSLHRCQSGAVQSLSFVLTLPAFILVMLFIIQVSQLMIGITVVHYAAYAGARSAAVWIPAEASYLELENVISGSVQQDGDTLRILPGAAQASRKFQKIQQAAVQACAPICPSRDLQQGTPNLPSWVAASTQTTTTLYNQMAPGQQSNPRVSARLQNKLAYSYQNTYVSVEWLEARHPEKDVEVSPTYNPRGHPNPSVPPWNPNEVGWQDPVTVRVLHRYALLSSAGKFLAARLAPADGKTVDLISPQISKDQQHYRETVYTIDLTAACTLTNEGLKSVVPYVQP